MSPLLFASLLCSLSAAADPAPPRKEILIGIEYAPHGAARAFAEMRVPLAKHYPDSVPWGEMQKSKDAAINFDKLDRFVREYHDAGFRELMLCLKSKNPWASKHALLNFSPKAEFMPAYEEWIRAVVERYDGDGKDDMPGLKRPVRLFEIGSEFSTFEPEPVEDYLSMLERAHKAAHRASPQVTLLHAAFLPTTAFKDHPKPSGYEAAFKAVDRRIMNKSLADMRALLDRSDSFDGVNFHALGDPYEIEDAVAWLRYEMQQRRFNKPIIISDTAPSPFIAWGPATKAEDKPGRLGLVIPPANERDRPRLAAYFTRLIDKDKPTLEWTHAFVAADMVKKIVISAEQGVALINASFMEDLLLFQTKPLQAGAGVSAWAGMAETRLLPKDERKVLALRPSFYAIQQLQAKIKGYTSAERIPIADGRIRWYRFSRGGNSFGVAWFETGKLILPEDESPRGTLSIKTTARAIQVEEMIHRAGQTEAERRTIDVAGGAATIPLTTRPVYIFEQP